MKRLVSGLVALVGLVALFVGVPALLVLIAGNPLPGQIPGLGEVRRTFVQADFNTDLLISVVAMVGWLVWLLAVWSVIWEFGVNMPRLLRGQSLRTGPIIPAPFGKLAASLMIAVVALVTPMKSGANAAPLPMPAPVAATQQVVVPARAASVTPDAATPSSQSTVTPTWLVERGDTLWDIAVETLGDGARVDDIVRSNPGLSASAILPVGTVLQLPSDATVDERHVAPAPEATPTVASDEVVVQKGDNLWNLTEARFGETNMDQIRSIADANQIADPDLIYPGDHIDLEPGSAPVQDDRPPPPQMEQNGAADAPSGQDDVVEAAPTTPQRFNIEIGPPPQQPGSPETSAPSGSSPTTTPNSAGQPLPAPDVTGRVTPPFDGGQTAESQGPSSISLTRFGITASGILALLAARRRRQLRSHLLPGFGGRGAADVEREMRDSARGPMPEPDFDMLDPLVDDFNNPVLDPVNRIDPIIGLVYEIADQHHASVRYIIDDPKTDRTEVVFDADVTLAPPWAGQGQRWSVEWADDPAGGWKTAPVNDVNPAPAMVLLGSDEQQRLIYGDLETIRALEISGPEQHAAAIASAIGMSLASRAEMSSASFVGIDVPSDVFLGHDGYLPADSFVSGLAAAKSALGSTIHQPSPLFRLRLQTGEPWEPVVVIVGPQIGRVEPIELTGAAVVSAAPIHGPSTVLSPDGDAWILRPGGISITPCGISSDEITRIWELFDRAGSGSIPVDSMFNPSQRIGLPPPRQDQDDAEDVRPDPPRPAADGVDAPLTVRLFAGMRISGPDGADVTFRRAASRELVAWLVTHRERSTMTGARASIWNFQIRAQAFANVLSDVRRSLNAVVAPPSGEDWVGHSDTERLPLHPGVQSDADVLRRAIAAASSAPTEAIAVLRPAVDLIEAAPFEATSYLWPEAEGLASELALLGAEAALQLAAAYESVGDVDGVLFATERGLRVIPGHERLTAMRIAVVGSVGDESAVAQTWNEYEQVLCDEPWAPAEASPELIDLRRGLGN